MKFAQRQNERLVVFMLLGGLALNYPLLAIFSKKALLFGIPILYLYLFSFWAFFILLIAMVMELGRKTSAPKQQSMTSKEE